MSKEKKLTFEQMKARQDKQILNVLIACAGLFFSLFCLAIAFPADVKRFVAGDRQEIKEESPVAKCRRPENIDTAFCQNFRGRPEQHWDSIRSNHGRPTPIFRLTEPKHEKLSGK